MYIEKRAVLCAKIDASTASSELGAPLCCTMKPSASTKNDPPPVHRRLIILKGIEMQVVDFGMENGSTIDIACVVACGQQCKQ